MKSYTDIDQSKRLAEILPLESADMHYSKDFDGSWFVDLAEYASVKIPKYVGNIEEHLLPCWSLAALLNYLKSKNKFPDIKELGDGRFKLTTFIWDGKKSFQVFIANNLVDACYKLVLKLHECEML